MQSTKLLQRIHTQCTVARAPPMLPEHLRHVLSTEQAFARDLVLKSSEMEVALQLYGQVFEAVAPRLAELNYCNLGWLASDVKLLCEALPRFASCRSLDLSGNKLKADGVQLLAEAVSDHTLPLETVHLDSVHGLPVKKIRGTVPARAVHTTGT